MNDLDMERRLTEALDAKAEQLVPSRTAPPPLDLERPAGTVTSLHRHRRVWIGTGLVAAAAAVVVGALVAVNGSDLSSRPAPVTPADRTTAPEPTDDGTPSVATTAPGSPTAAATSVAPPAAATTSVSLDGVTVAVPAEWQAAPASSSTPFRCLTVGGVAQQTSDNGFTGNCELRWEVGTSLGDPDPDVLEVFGDNPLGCVATTVQGDEVTVDGQIAEHRVFTGTCFQGTREQWTVLTTPVVVFARDVPNASDTDVTAARTAVQGARLPARTSSVRVFDYGFPRSATTTSLTVDRVTLFGGEGAHIQDLNPATYSYRLTPATVILAPDNSTPSLDRFAALVNSGDWSSVGLSGTAVVRIQTDGSSVTFVDIEPTP